MLQAHDDLALRVHKAMVAIVSVRNSASQKLNLYRKCKSARPLREAASGVVAPAVVTPAQSRKRRADAAAALAGSMPQSSCDSEGLPLTSAGKYLNVVYNSFEHFFRKSHLYEVRPVIWEFSPKQFFARARCCLLPQNG